MSDESSDPLLEENKKSDTKKRVEKVRQSLSEQTPSVLLLLALLFGVVAGLVAYVYSKCASLPTRLEVSIRPTKVCEACVKTFC